MFKLTVVFIALLNGVGGEEIPFGRVTSVTAFVSREACQVAGEFVVERLSPSVDAMLKSREIGVLRGAEVHCDPIESERIPS